jgi:hypothetical protein
MPEAAQGEILKVEDRASVRVRIASPNQDVAAR